MNTPHIHEWLADGLLHGTAFLGLALVAERLLRRGSAARRHGLLLGAALGLPLLLGTSAVLPSWSIPAESASPPPVVEVTVSREIVLGSPVENARTMVPESAPAAPEASARPPIAATMLAVWIAGTALLWLRWTFGCLSLRRLNRRLSPSTDFDSLLAEECPSLGIHSMPRLFLGHESMPMTWGLRRHCIVLPDEATSWSDTKLRGVLRHELAHIARHDCATASVASLCLALAWFHPFAWLLQRALRRSREAACDDLVISGRNATVRHAYARDLVEIVATHSRIRLPGVALAMGAAQTRLMKHRLAAILDKARDRRPVTRRLTLACAPLWIIAIAALGMTSAFRVAGVAQEVATPKTSGEIVERSYELIDSQLRQLIDYYDYEEPKFDPESFAEQARRKLIENFGLRIRSADPVKIHFPARFRLEVSAPDSIQNDVAWALDSMIDGNQIEVKLHVFELDDPKWIVERIGKGAEKASVMTPAEFAILRKEITERGGESKAFPHLITRVGQRAKVEMIREFIYPTEYDPPQLSRGNQEKEDEKKENEPTIEEALAGGVKLDNSVFGISPANPTSFEMRPVGLTWETDPTITRDGAINMVSFIEDTQFLGFINYGSPIRGAGGGLFKKSVILTENQILMPVFETEKISTRITLTPGQVVALRGFSPDSNPPMEFPDYNMPDLPENPRANAAKRAYRIYVIEARISQQK